MSARNHELKSHKEFFSLVAGGRKNQHGSSMTVWKIAK